MCRAALNAIVLMHNFIRLSDIDNVVTATRTIGVGENIAGIKAIDTIPRGHKMATQNIAEGETVRKYGQKIGLAHSAIAQGAHVHTHNLAFEAVDQAYAFSTDCQNARANLDPLPDHFLGYQRGDGSVGTRNYIAIITSVNCSATAARRIADCFGPEELAAFPNVDGVVAYVHGTGCGMADSGDGFDALQRVMWGYAKHPNNAAVLMLGLGCEMNQIDWLLDMHGLKQGETFQALNIQSVAGLQKTIEKGVEKIKAMLPIANQIERTPCPLSALTLALQCGGSDAWSGVGANPALGYACDLLVSAGGAGVLAETPEVYGAEHLLTARAKDRAVGEKLIARIKWWEDYTSRNLGTMDNNPSPGNKKGGLTTILEKSLGAVAKGGTTTLMNVYKYAEPIKDRGFLFMDSPGYDPASVTGQIASGCNLVAFTTGRGSAFGSKPAPTLKIASNSDMFHRMEDDMDINAGSIVDGVETVEEVGRRIFSALIAAASGQHTKSEMQGLGDYEFVPWQIGATM